MFNDSCPQGAFNHITTGLASELASHFTTAAVLVSINFSQMWDNKIKFEWSKKLGKDASAEYGKHCENLTIAKQKKK